MWCVAVPPLALSLMVLQMSPASEWTQTCVHVVSACRRSGHKQKVVSRYVLHPALV